MNPQSLARNCVMEHIGHARIEAAMLKSDETRQTMSMAAKNLDAIPSLVAEMKVGNRNNTLLLLFVAFVLVVNAALVANISFRASGFGVHTEIGTKGERQQEQRP